MIETAELVCKRIHMPYANVRIPAGTRVAIGPLWIAEALCVRGFFEKVPEDILKQEREAEAKRKADARISFKADVETKAEKKAAKKSEESSS